MTENRERDRASTQPGNEDGRGGRRKFADKARPETAPDARVVALGLVAVLIAAAIVIGLVVAAWA